jgi:RNA polymerase sigma-70 factor (ECF subfamily)
MTHLDTLIDRWKAGEARAAEEIFNLHRDRVYRLSYGLLGNAQDAEEATQDALTYALLKIDNFDPRRSQFTTWLHMITVSRCRDLHRKRHMPTLSLSEWFHSRRKEPASEITPEHQAIRGETRQTIWGAVQGLPSTLREAIVLRHWGGHTYQEIADIVGCPIRTAQSRVRLAHQRLKRNLTESNLQPILQENNQ